MALLEQGYEVLVVADAGGSPDKTANDLSLNARTPRCWAPTNCWPIWWATGRRRKAARS
nr:hypothetical protein [Achromobacter xylosoxidans]